MHVDLDLVLLVIGMHEFIGASRDRDETTTTPLLLPKTRYDAR
jgi:hypothetical protein